MHTVTFSALTKTGHTFTGWFTEVSGGEEIMPSTAVCQSSNKTVYAQWITKQLHYVIRL